MPKPYNYMDALEILAASVWKRLPSDGEYSNPKELLHDATVEISRLRVENFKLQNPERVRKMMDADETNKAQQVAN